MTYPTEPLRIIDYPIQNKLPVAVENTYTLDANRVMYLLNRILSGEYRARSMQWNTAGRPTAASTPVLVTGEIGFNTDFSGLEMYTGVTYGWQILCGIWTIGNAPAVNIAPGSRGFCIDVGPQLYDGSQWNLG